MVSKYFEITTSSESFKKKIEELLSSLSGKKVILYGAGEGFIALNNMYNFKEKLDIAAISDKKFSTGKEHEFCGIKAIAPEQIKNESFDVILITNEKATLISDFLKIELNIDNKVIQSIFTEEIKDEISNLNYLYEHHFDKTLPKLLKKLKNKKVIFYGAGVFLEIIKKYFDISSLNVIGIADKKYSNLSQDESFLGYKKFAPEEILKLKPDYVIVTTRYYIRIIEDLHYNLLKKSKIKIKPLVEKSFMTLFKEIQKL